MFKKINTQSTISLYNKNKDNDFKVKLKNYFLYKNIKNLKSNKIQSVLLNKMNKNINKFKIKIFSNKLLKNKSIVSDKIIKLKNEENYFLKKKIKHNNNKNYFTNKKEWNKKVNIFNYEYYNSDYYDNSINKRAYLFSNVKLNLIYKNNRENCLNSDYIYLKNCIKVLKNKKNESVNN